MNSSRLALLLLAVPLLGVTSTGTVSVSGTVAQNCTISGSTLAFGPYNVLATSPLQANASAISVACTRGSTSVTIGLNAGSNAAHASGTTRAMSNGAGGYLSYDLYTSGTYGTVWSTSNTVSYSPTSLATTSFTVYGQIPALQNVVVGSYTDSITATVTF